MSLLQESLFAVPVVLPRFLDVEGDERSRVEVLYYEWLLAALADAVRQAILSKVLTFNRKRDTVLELLDAIEDIQAEVLGRL